MLFNNIAASAIAALAFTANVVAFNFTPVKYYGSKGALLSGGASTKAAIIYTSGTVPSLNGTIVSGGIAAQTRAFSDGRDEFASAISVELDMRQVLTNIAAIFEEAGTSWEYALKTTVMLANMSDFAAMNAVYGEFLPNPKPARTTFQVGKLPGDFLIEIEAIAAIPEINWA